MGKKRASGIGATSKPSKGNSMSEDQLVAVAMVTLRQRLSQSVLPACIHGYEKERKELTDLVQRTVTTGESNSVLVIGHRGTGKSVLVKSVLEKVRETTDAQHNLVTVHLNGLLQTDDRLALKEITRQLQLENSVGDRVFGSFAENLQFLLEALRSGDHGSKAIVLTLDEFDMFAQHRGQTLLYNLFDVCQSAQTPICVIGVTCRFDVVELLEKRVKSRFSHRQIYLFDNVTLDDYVSLCVAYLSLDDTFPDDTYRDRWNAHIQDLVKQETVRNVISRQFSLTTNVRDLILLLTPIICTVNPNHPNITVTDFVEAFQMKYTDCKSSMMHGVSILELCLIIAMKHLTEIYDGEPFNFEMVYSEYLKFAQRRASVQVFDKAVVLKAFEHLLALELIRPMDNSTSRVQKEYRLVTLLLHPTQILEALQKYPSCPTEVKAWAGSAVV
ncbi:origin recognition complex subunit 4-like [Littorina saxatilis]|uniref:Origin recognition complex subunit 4 n=1 Tax=Littorina saxatilis TaxID=31220 RepID=A0AAN9AT93_9CAEN